MNRGDRLTWQFAHVLVGPPCLGNLFRIGVCAFAEPSESLFVPLVLCFGAAYAGPDGRRRRRRDTLRVQRSAVRRLRLDVFDVRDESESSKAWDSSRQNFDHHHFVCEVYGSTVCG